MFILEVAPMLEVLSGKAIRAAGNERMQEISGDYGFHLNSNLASRTFPLLHSAALSRRVTVAEASATNNIYSPCRTESNTEVAEVLTDWPIRKKLTIGIVLLLIAVAILASSGLSGVYAFRSLARSVSQRASELPIALRLARDVSAMNATVPSRREVPAATPGREFGISMNHWVAFDFDRHLNSCENTLREYEETLLENSGGVIGGIGRELEIVGRMKTRLATIQQLKVQDQWPFEDSTSMDLLETSVADLQMNADQLPSFLQKQMNDLQGAVKFQYRTWMVLTYLTGIAAGLLLLIMFRLFYQWVLCPLRTLIEGSRHVASGDFNHRIRLDSGDEMDELAQAMNDMTERFQQIKNDLDAQVQERTREVVRGEQLASVGFLAAGVAHEINNPLASIAFCADSLVDRMQDVLRSQDTLSQESQSTEEIEVIREYLKMIQEEAFRCKEITERLLDFSRLGHVERQEADLRELVQGVIDMVRHVGSYKQKEIVFHAPNPVMVGVNPQEMKQVLLNLITNGLDSLETDGVVSVSLVKQKDMAQLIVTDNGCGMTEEVKKHLFEPFFTSGKDGHGTGLGMSITYRIVDEHGGHIDVFSDGPGKGSSVTVRLPLDDMTTKENHHRHHAA